MSCISFRSIGELGNAVRRTPGGPAHHHGGPAPPGTRQISAFGQAVRIELGLLVRLSALMRRSTPHDSRASSAGDGGCRSPGVAPGTARGLDLSLTAGTARTRRVGHLTGSRYAVRSTLPLWNCREPSLCCGSLLRITLAEHIPDAQQGCGTLWVMADERDALIAATKRYEQSEAVHEDARQQAIQAVLAALRVGIGPTEVERLSPFTGAYIRKIARENGVPPAAPGPKRATA